MEKLRSAIENARRQRQGLPSKLVLTPDTRRSALASLKPLETSRIAMRRNRVLTSFAGSDSAPIDMLRTRILQQAADNSWKRIALVSPHAGSGKTTMAANLAFSLGRQDDRSTIVLDLDLRKPSLAGVLGHAPQYSMGDVLQGNVRFSDHGCRYGENLAFGLNDRPSPNAPEILQSRKTSRILDEISEEYDPDIMLFDMPPLMSTDDSYGFLKNADCALLIVEAEKTTAPQADLAERQIAELTNFMGIVLNKSNYGANNYGYGNS